MNLPDEELRARFDRLRRDDRAHTPSFREVWNRAESRARMTRRALPPALLWSAAAGVVLALGLALRRAGDGDRARLAAVATPSGPQRAPVTSAWISPTAGLLRTWGGHVLAPPSILSSVLDGMTRSRLQPKGD